MDWVLIGIIVYMLCGFLSIGYNVAEFQGMDPTDASVNYPYDLGFALIFALFGPAALVISILGSGFGQHGWHIRPKKTEGHDVRN